jgi:predicted DNA-binding protein YlxM (UPF0122 family)
VLEKTTRVNYLFDFYHPLLTPKQRTYMELYYLDDLSLGEIAEQYEVSRQAVYDNIKRTEAMLEGYEQKLGLLEKYKQRDQLLSDFRQLIEGASDKEELLTMIDRIEKLD